MTSGILLVEEDGALVIATLNRPDKLNALDFALLAEIGALVAELTARPAAKRPRVLVVTGAGDKAFAAGADVAQMSELSPEQARTFSEHGQRVGRALEEAPFPSIAAVNGFALGGGAELALICDFIYASDRARFGQPEVGLGLLPGFGGTQRLARRRSPGPAAPSRSAPRAASASPERRHRRRPARPPEPRWRPAARRGPAASAAARYRQAD
jgi:enoyl-CoA hydratase